MIYNATTWCYREEDGLLCESGSYQSGRNLGQGQDFCKAALSIFSSESSAIQIKQIEIEFIFSVTTSIMVKKKKKKLTKCL